MTIILFLMMVVITGMAIDLMRHETHRAEMQNALDRGLLAATDLDQDLSNDEAEALVVEYFRSALWVGNEVTPEVEVLDNTTVLDEEGIGSREMVADAVHTLNTAFLRIIGRPTMPVIVEGGAAERRKDVELSVVLDISGTMRYCGPANDPCEPGEWRRMDFLIDAAQHFFDRVIDQDSANTTSVNIVPYAGSVNVGPDLFTALGGERVYLEEGGVATDPDLGVGANYADHSCLELGADDFSNEGLPSGGDYAQVPQFHHWTIDWTNMDWGWCPSDNVDITLMNGVNEDELVAQNLSDELQRLSTNMHDGTGTNIGTYYGVALLDPASRDAIAPFVPERFAGERPSDWFETTTLKVLVVMTDGQITGQVRPEDPTDPVLATTETNPGGAPNWVDAVEGNTAEDQFAALCDYAKDHDVVVYTIAFYAPEEVKGALRSCATNPDEETHFYDVQGEELRAAFDEIATTIFKVKLIR
ncbi:MAG: Tad domain-containing protein [Pseudomonadota bacterium]